jgi:hypothetical protein
VRSRTAPRRRSPPSSSGWKNALSEAGCGGSGSGRAGSVSVGIADGLLVVVSDGLGGALAELEAVGFGAGPPASDSSAPEQAARSNVAPAAREAVSLGLMSANLARDVIRDSRHDDQYV